MTLIIPLLMMAGAKSEYIIFNYTDCELEPTSWENHPHAHDHYEIMVCISGSFKIIVESSVFYPKRGEIRTYAANEIHMGQILKPCRFENFQISIPRNSFTLFKNHGLLRCFTEREMGEKNLIFSKNSEFIINSLYMLKEIIEYDIREKYSISLGILLQILGMIDNAFFHALPSSVNMTQIPPILRKILNLIDLNSRNYNSIKDISEAAGISVAYLTKIFRIHMGCSPYKYLISIKLENAKYSLRQGKNVTETCYDCGFKDYNNFIVLFKKHAGITPHKYSRKYPQENSIFMEDSLKSY